MRIEFQPLACLRSDQAVGVKARGLRSSTRDRDDLEEEGWELLVGLESLGQRLALLPCGPASGVAFREAGFKPGRDGQRIPPRGAVWTVRDGTLLGSLQVGC